KADTFMVKVIRCHEYGPPDVLRIDEVAPRDPDPGEIRVRLGACAVNFPDILSCAGTYQTKPDFPFSPGMEAAGEIIDCGAGVDGYQMGDRVMLWCGPHHDGYAEEVTLPAETAFPVSETMSDVEAAGFMLVYGTAWHGLVDCGHLQDGETVAVHGASGGVGMATVQLAKALGATVIASAGSDEKLGIVAAQGADYLINYTTEDTRQRLKELTVDSGLNVAFDTVGGDAFRASLSAISPEGRILIVGFTSGDHAQVPINIILVKGASLIAVRFGWWSLAYPERTQENHRQLLALYDAGKLKPYVGRTYPLDQAVDALHALQNREVTGKIILTV
ncbi:MAG: NADPH:quinone oxidoreductase family protein, partial [Alphaproteobacteria bacterium]|nr:NADPH:quinone oxidoreductase family protein [Alphaproteobacteria bacterium]